MADVVLKKVQKSFGDVRVLQDIDLTVRDGEFMVFVGPSGCGKSTLLRLIAGLEDLSGGDMTIGGKLVNDVPPAERGIAMVFQSYALYPHMDLYENMAFGLRLAKMPAAAIDQAVQRAARILHIEHLLRRKPRDLSGGQRQRVAIGRAIVRQPEVFLFDEPLSNLDAALRVKMRYEFARLHEELKTTMVYVTHDQVEAMTLADRIVVLSAGRIEQIGTPLALYEHPCNRFVAGFIGSPRMNFIDGRLLQGDAEGAVLTLAGGVRIECRIDARGLAAGEPVTLGIRPEHLVLGARENLLPATVSFVESLGSTTFAYCDLPGNEDALTCEFDGRTRLTVGDRLELSVPADLTHVFRADGSALPRRGLAERAQAA